jgi:hypothetical protein
MKMLSCFLLLWDVMSAGIGIVQPCALATSKATPIGEIVSVSWYDDS